MPFLDRLRGRGQSTEPDRRAMAGVGDAVEARAADFAQAAPLLRMALIRTGAVPGGDVSVPTFVPEFREVLALDAGTSLRYVRCDLAEAWSVPVDQLVDLADRAAIGAGIEIIGRPAPSPVAVATPRDHGPYAGTLARRLDLARPDAIGPLGSLIAVPTTDGCLSLPLAPSASLGEDLLELVLLATRVAGEAPHAVEPLPYWRRPDGTLEQVTFEFDAGRPRIADSHHPGFAGVLVALGVVPAPPAPAWAADLFARAEYGVFAGLVSASCTVRPEAVAGLGSRVEDLARECSTRPRDTWGSLVAEAFPGGAGPLGHEATRAPVTVEDLVAVLRPEGSVPAGTLAHPSRVGGLVEVLATDRGETVDLITTTEAADLGTPQRLLDVGYRRVLETASAVPSDESFVSGVAVRVAAHPEPSILVPDLHEVVPAAAGSDGTLVVAPTPDLVYALPVTDRLAILDLPGLFGLARGTFDATATGLTPSCLSLSGTGIGTAEVAGRREPGGAGVGGARIDEVFETWLARLPAARPARVPRLIEILGARAGAWLNLFCDEFLERLRRDASSVTVLRVPDICSFAEACVPLPETEWATTIRAQLDEVDAPRRQLDRLMGPVGLSEVAPYLTVRVRPGAPSLHAISRAFPGQIAAEVCLSVGSRHRLVVRSALAAWNASEDALWAIAAANTARAPGLRDEPVDRTVPHWRALYEPEHEMEAAGLFLHLREKSKKGWVVSITHGSRAHFVRLDERGAVETIPAFAAYIADIYAAASAASDGTSPWLLWLQPDGTPVELFDTRRPPPPPDRLPPGFAALLRR
jgi:hypothetical protein